MSGERRWGESPLKKSSDLQRSAEAVSAAGELAGFFGECKDCLSTVRNLLLFWLSSFAREISFHGCHTESSAIDVSTTVTVFSLLSAPKTTECDLSTLTPCRPSMLLASLIIDGNSRDSRREQENRKSQGENHDFEKSLTQRWDRSLTSPNIKLLLNAATGRGRVPIFDCTWSTAWHKRKK